MPNCYYHTSHLVTTVPLTFSLYVRSSNIYTDAYVRHLCGVRHFGSSFVTSSTLFQEIACAPGSRDHVIHSARSIVNSFSVCWELVLGFVD
ncbi:hypothetical protein K443DRAFT_331317 [Laccaria amethystina LaAM-08-1]|uniref:Uncharacterized protein n=1 Tax=Laccaria amethystina LaAM-08-1 TaxID=1095629 RepID=A0A0C9XC00_9AGAR|nr:hypothetical protein K443DRAFT_331317 [Laccaria amethystina LaAM-08-1]